MPKFFVHLDEPDAITDMLGQDLPNLQSAKCAALRMVAETLCQNPQALWDATLHQVRVADAWGLTLFVVDIQTTPSPAIERSIRRLASGA